MKVDVLNEVVVVLLLHYCLIGEPPVFVSGWKEEPNEKRQGAGGGIKRILYVYDALCKALSESR